MRRRVWRDAGTILGVVVVLSGVVALNYFTRQKNLQERMIEWRKEIEENRETKGLDLLPWDILVKTKGNMRRGAKFPPELLLWDNKHIDLIGFMVPVDEYRNMKEFLLLPMPIQCYFCESPPMRDIILVKMLEGEKTELFNEPILINGILKLHGGAGAPFFYSVEKVTFGPGEEKGTLTRKSMSAEHVQHYEAARVAREKAEEELLSGQEPPKALGPEGVVEPMTDAAKENLLTAELFFEENAKQEGVKEIEFTGVQYKVLEEGTGLTPLVHDKVRIHYRGTLLDGTEFDSSYERDKPLVSSVNKFIPGWTDALLHMKEGDRWLVFVPPDRAYGEKGRGRIIPPNSALIFEIELLKVLGPDGESATSENHVGC